MSTNNNMTKEEIREALENYQQFLKENIKDAEVEKIYVPYHQWNALYPELMAGGNLVPTSQYSRNVVQNFINEIIERCDHICKHTDLSDYPYNGIEIKICFDIFMDSEFLDKMRQLPLSTLEEYESYIRMHALNSSAVKDNTIMVSSMIKPVVCDENGSVIKKAYVRNGGNQKQIVLFSEFISAMNQFGVDLCLENGTLISKNDFHICAKERMINEQGRYFKKIVLLNQYLNKDQSKRERTI